MRSECLLEDTKIFICFLITGVVLINIGNLKYGFGFIIASIITFIIIKFINSAIDDSKTENREIAKVHKVKKLLLKKSKRQMQILMKYIL